MTDKLRNEIVLLRDSGRSIRGISRQLHLSRQTIRRVLAQVRKQRHEAGSRARRPPQHIHRRKNTPKIYKLFVVKEIFENVNGAVRITMART